jgi:hypothetical protein
MRDTLYTKIVSENFAIAYINEREIIMQGIIYVKVALYLETDVTEEQAQEIVNEMDYEISHQLISYTEIKEIIED